MSTKRTVMLFGSGAVIPWGGPKTSFLTELIQKSGFMCDDEKTRVTDFISQTLMKNGYCIKDINFETIINIIEELIIHYAFFDNTTELPSFNKVFFNSKFENSILNFSIRGGIKKHLYKLDIPKNKEYVFSKAAYNNESPEQFYFQHLLTDLLTNINAQISKYAYHTEGNSKIFSDENKIINKDFQSWLKNHSDNSIIRMYTLNYDRVFKVLSEKIGISTFEGFECGEFVPQNGVLPNVKKILSDFDSNIHYNLHGSAFWNVYPRDSENNLLSPYIKLHPYPKLNINNNENTTFQMEKGKSILISNIITGYQKTQKSFITPFKQMQSAFDRDCCFADDLFIIGYSFGDAHINVSIKTALKCNKDLKLHFIDPIYCEKNEEKGYDLLVDRLINIFPEILNIERTQIKQFNDNDTFVYFDGKLTIDAISFDVYLNRLNGNTNF